MHGEFSLIWRRHRNRWRAANFDLCSALMAIEKWEFFNVQHPLRHGPTVYNGHLWGPVTLTPVAERLAVELSLPVFLRLGSVATGYWTPISRMRDFIMKYRYLHCTCSEKFKICCVLWKLSHKRKTIIGINCSFVCITSK